MNKDRKQLYEGMYILQPILSEEARKKTLEKITANIEEVGGEVHKIHDQGRRKLAYEIRGSREGYYFLIYFTSPTTKLADLWREYRLNENLLRFMTVKSEEIKQSLEYKKLPE